jgi:hypothetical protein
MGKDQLTGKGVGPGVGPRTLGGGNTQQTGPEGASQGRPPEFLEAYRNFTTRQGPGEGKTPRK